MVTVIQRPLCPPDAPPSTRYDRVGVLLINLGTPDLPETGAVRRYLKQFLSDSRVIEINKWLWWPILNGPILTFRSPKTARNYQKIWAEDSPLRLGTREVTEALEEKMGSDDLVIRYAMRYGNPSVPDVLDEMQKAGCDRIVCMALYPQYSATTTASAYDAVFRWSLSARWQSAVRTVPDYHDHPLYIAALKASLERAIDKAGWEPDVILASFHGLPQRNTYKGDPYQCQCLTTGDLLRQAMGMDDRKLRTCFQSRFGPQEWLQPYTDDLAEELAEQGVKKLMIISPGFAADCIETLEELAMGTQEIFKEAGGEQFAYVPCLNDAPEAVKLYQDILSDNLAGWLDQSLLSSGLAASIG
ncbi:MAG: ferrochelatase [Sphingomonadales bacterium]